MEGDLVLDPFCGTGSLLLPCAFLGADVMGSDIDADCLGLVDRDLLTYSDRSKNSNFVRLDGLKNEQLSGSTRTNFEYYGLLPHLKGLFGVDAMKWCTEELGDFQVK
jgi:tRNA G10  N-methylase Trm11